MEPAGPDRNVGLAGTPHDTVRIPVLQPLAHLRRIVPGIRHERGIDRAPVRIARGAPLVADPPDVRTRIREHQRTRLQPANRAVHAIPIVHLLLAVRPLAVRTVEEEFDDRPVLRQQLGQLRDVVVVVARAVAVRALVTVPRRQIQTGPQPFGAHRIHELAHHVAVTVAPQAVLHRVLREPARPQAESIVMLRRQDHVLESAGPRRARPLPRVESPWIELLWLFATVAPFAIGEGVHPEVREHPELGPLPPELRTRRDRPSGTRRAHEPGHAPRRADGSRTCDQEFAPPHWSPLARLHLTRRPSLSVPLTRRPSLEGLPAVPIVSRLPMRPPTPAAPRTSRRSDSVRARAPASLRTPTQ